MKKINEYLNAENIAKDAMGAELHNKCKALEAEAEVETLKTINNRQKNLIDTLIGDKDNRALDLLRAEMWCAITDVLSLGHDYYWRMCGRISDNSKEFHTVESIRDYWLSRARNKTPNKEQK